MQLRILIAGGVYRLTPDARARKRPAPEEVLEAGLRAAGEDVDTISLKDFRAGLLSSGYDIIHVHHMSKMAVMQALTPRPMVFTHHASTFGNTLVQRSAERLVWKRSNRIVCLSEQERRDKIAHLPKLATKFAVIPNGIPAMAPDHGPTLRRWEEGEEFRIAVVGQLIDVKRPELALHALRGLPDYVRLDFTYHNNELESELRRLASDLGVSGRVSFLGQAGGDELHRRYLRAHVLLMTSYAEALPSVVSEALTTGCPVVATDTGGIREQVATAGVLVDRDAATYSSAIGDVIAGYGTFASEALARGRDLEREFSPDLMALRHIELYKTILGEV